MGIEDDTPTIELKEASENSEKPDDAPTSFGVSLSETKSKNVSGIVYQAPQVEYQSPLPPEN